ncbi:hypothetical protein [Virgibacillus halodenitrificans]|uniref:hypothetical protein n=1 Tax=Virgibacillus halodenitrificans TaxID=1482 RepID=UPI000EF481D1|nr:hypothetical protein [Virgibacillus halodenitrificans]
MNKKSLLFFGLIAFFFAVVTACSNDTSKENTNDKSTTEEDQTEKQEAEIKEGEKENESVKEEDQRKQYSNNEVDSQNSEEKQASDSATTNKNTTSNSDTSSSEESDNNKEDAKGIHLKSGEEAITYLRKELEMEDVDTIEFDDRGGNLSTDEYGSYYTVVLLSKEWKEGGGSGTLERYKVYQDGKYELDF